MKKLIVGLSLIVGLLAQGQTLDLRRISELPSTNSVTTNDIMPIVSQPFTPNAVTRRILLQDVVKSLILPQVSTTNLYVTNITSSTIITTNIIVNLTNTPTLGPVTNPKLPYALTTNILADSPITRLDSTTIGTPSIVVSNSLVGLGAGSNWVDGVFIGRKGLLLTNSFVDIRQFGADPSSSDNTTAIQAAITYAAGVPVHIPVGTWLVDSLAVSGNLIIQGSKNAILKQIDTSRSSMFQFNGSSVIDGHFDGLILDGNKQGRTNAWDDIVNLSALICTTNSNQRIFCSNMIFTNSIRTAIRVAGYLDVQRCRFEAANEHNGTSITHYIFAQPTGFSDYLKLRVVDSDFVATSWADADLYKQSAGIFLTLEGSGGYTNKYKDLVVMGNRSIGVGCTRASNPSGFLDTYNGAARVVAIGNTIYKTAYSAFKIQRCDDAVVDGNIIDGVSNTDDNVTFAIDWSPTAREGATPFTGSLTNQQHYNFTCVNNIIKNSHRTAIYIDGSDAIVANNTIDTVGDSNAGDNLPLVATGGNNIIAFNKFHSMSKNGIWIVGSTNLTVFGNVFNPISANATDTLIQLNGVRRANVMQNVLLPNRTTNTAIGINTINSEDVIIEGNKATLCQTSYQFQNSTNCTLRNNYSFVSGWNDIASTNAVNLRVENNSWQQWQYRYDTNGLAYMSVQNLNTNTAARSLIEVLSSDNGGYMASYPSNASNTRLAARLVVGANTTARGITLDFATNQSVKIEQGTNVVYEAITNYTKITGLANTPLQLNSWTSSGTYLIYRNQDAVKRYFGWSGVLNGIIGLDSSGSTVNFEFLDDGQFKQHGLATFDTNVVIGNISQLGGVSYSAWPSAAGVDGAALTHNGSLSGTLSWVLPKVTAQKNGVYVGRQPTISFNEGSGVSLSMSEDSGSSRVNVTISATSTNSATNIYSFQNPLTLVTTNVYIATNGISDILLRQSLANSVIGRSAGSSGTVADISASADNQFLGRISGTLQFSAIPSNVTTQKVIISTNGTTVGTRQKINLIPGSNITLGVADNGGSDRVDVTINSTATIGSLTYGFLDFVGAGEVTMSGSYADAVFSVSGGTLQTSVLTPGTYIVTLNTTAAQYRTTGGTMEIKMVNTETSSDVPGSLKYVGPQITSGSFYGNWPVTLEGLVTITSSGRCKVQTKDSLGADSLSQLRGDHTTLRWLKVQ